MCQGQTRVGGVHSSSQNVHESAQRETCLRETETAPVKTGWAETDKGQPRKPNVRARWVVKEYMSTRKARVGRLDAAAGGTESRVVRGCHGQTWRKSWGTCRRRAYFYAPSGRRVFVELPSEVYQADDEPIHVRAVAMQLVRHA